jgi:hypothetical protein
VQHLFLKKCRSRQVFGLPGAADMIGHLLQAASQTRFAGSVPMA